MFDLDGTLVLGDRASRSYILLPGALEVVSTLKAKSIPFNILTNGSAYPPPEQAARLRKVGLDIDDDQMLTPSSVTADYLQGKGVKRVLVLGSPGVAFCLTEIGLEAVFPGDPGEADVQAVYVGWHPDCNMRDIESAAKAIWGGAKLYVASDVPFFATKEGRSIGYSHAIVAAIRSLTGGRQTVLGKPSLHALRFVSRRLGVPIGQIGVVGDDPQLETAMARRGGAVGFGVATGLTRVDDWAAQPPAWRPHHVLETVGELINHAPLAD
jgi:HAD superfamily hydrolase (TIGR01450 family)